MMEDVAGVMSGVSIVPEPDLSAMAKAFLLFGRRMENLNLGLGGTGGGGGGGDGGGDGGGEGAVLAVGAGPISGEGGGVGVGSAAGRDIPAGDEEENDRARACAQVPGRAGARG
jgi:hypothetical protein